ncbi:MAG: alpha/beta hydrolase [Butyrivibrio sp.]|nr:alpha/beta hydrolase [Butyrivibrio sp.]
MEKAGNYRIISEMIEVKKENGRMIRGLVYRPDAEGEFPTVIFSHGFGGSYKFLMHHGGGYAENGIVCVFFDFCGGGMDSESEGSMLEMTVMTEAGDLVEVMDAVKKYPYVDDKKLFLQGESQGGFVTAIVGRAYQEDVKGLILWYPAFVIPDDAKKRIEEGKVIALGLQISPHYDEVAKDIDVKDLQTGFEKPVLILHGNKDEVVPIEYARTAAANYGCATLKEIQGAGHGFEGHDSDMAREESISFIKTIQLSANI